MEPLPFEEANSCKPTMKQDIRMEVMSCSLLSLPSIFPPSLQKGAAAHQEFKNIEAVNKGGEECRLLATKQYSRDPHTWL